MTRARPPSDRPNFVFILGDDWGWGDLGCFGHPHVQTPHLDRLAAQGTRFTHFYVNASVCSPSRAAFMTGRFPGTLGIHTIIGAPEQNRASGVPDFLDPHLPTLPRLLKQRGYATGHFGKWHLGRDTETGPGSAPPPTAYGFDESRAMNGAGPNWFGIDEGNAPESVATIRPRSTELIVDETIRFVEAHRDSPFYVQAWLLDPHAILNPTEEQLAPYERFSPQHVTHKGATAIYYATITEADRQLGRLFDRLDQLGLAENTVIVFTGDNGPEDLLVRNASHSAAGSPGPFRGRKRSLYDGGIRMPLIVRWPGHVAAGRVDDDSLVSGVDLLPTACRMAGVSPPEDAPFDGEDISPALTGEPYRRRRPLFWQWRFPIIGHVIDRSPMLAVREGQWKLLLNPDRSRVELYDVSHDPTELTDRAAQQPEVVERLAAQALTWSQHLPAGPIAPGAGRNAYTWPH